VDESSAFQNSIQDGGRQVVVVQHLSPLAERFIGGKDHRSLSQVAIVDDMKQDIGGIGTVGSVTNFIDDQNMGMRVD
jgi:hypothetical protein